ncbi:MAG: YebC/PmpR family DNA-binding transcriptional regulator, partial [Clostridiales bacterium]|nr:YebC/PmpR family DNA-binding transcriptional regulator [Clostridiales bacterium]
QDAKRANLFTKIAKEILVAVKEGGGPNPESNSRLATVITKARAANMPNDNIKRAIEKASGAGNSENFETVIYEGYGPNGVAIIVETLTDNRNRTAADVRHAFDKYGGNMGTSGCVSWSFKRKGIVIIDNEDGELNEETVLEHALDSGAEDMQSDESIFEITSEPENFNEMAEYLTKKGYKFLSAQVEMVPDNYIRLDDESSALMQKMLDMFDDNDDVQEIWHNWENYE